MIAAHLYRAHATPPQKPPHHFLFINKNGIALYCRVEDMTQKNNPTGALMVSENEPSAEELDACHRVAVFIPTDEVTSDTYPRLENMSAGFLFRAAIRPTQADLLKPTGQSMLPFLCPRTLLWPG